jgi:hypothetical protein
MRRAHARPDTRDSATSDTGEGALLHRLDHLRSLGLRSRALQPSCWP